MPVFRIGADDFKKLRDNGGYFVDKSLLIKEIIEGNDVALLPRPRRFGKTLNMTLLRYFFELSEDNRRYLFEDLNIANHPDCMKHQGQYPVVFISLKDVKGTCFGEMKQRLIEKIGELLIQFRYLSINLEPIYEKGFHALISGTPDDATLKASLKNLITWLYLYHQKPVIVLIDEYDSPMIEAWTNGYYPDLADFMRSWLGGGLKPENAHTLYRAVITGILRVAKESIFSDLNNLKVITTLQSHATAQMFGFTEGEVDKILTDFSIPEHDKIIREWYNGYRFGNQTIYNPWSVTNYIDNLPNPPGPHWLNTSANTLVYEELGQGGIEIKRDLEKLLTGKEIRYPINETVTFRDMGRNPANIWSFLYFSGYLRAEDPQEDIRGRTTYQLSIPNREIGYAYEYFIESIYPKPGGGLDALMEWFTKENPISVLEEILQSLTLNLLSYHDFARLPEAIFHAFVLGLLANLRSVYDIRSNAESGFGRADILMIPKGVKYATTYVIEFKSVHPQEKIEESAKQALDQIHEKQYDILADSPGLKTKHVRRLAIVVQGKKVIIRE
ncbi:ATP-binding protein [Methanospirillum stamsii]|uniref:AAA family ATPase n=1 Tax=Methanospirillum stamsii TaxID=1277351 RepID=A0A2V2MMX2_9EURY|nr:ATP-binding protein [Methanospirillum stamsii]PWR69604.1 AAA family ATPase [Methanospirillum stamsii]